MSNSKKSPPAVVANVGITSRGANPAIDITGSTMTLNTQATLQMGNVRLTEGLLVRMEAALEFVERFAAENEEARAVWTAIKAKKRILK
jgi:C4-type Zn-finger protein